MMLQLPYTHAVVNKKKKVPPHESKASDSGVFGAQEKVAEGDTSENPLAISGGDYELMDAPAAVCT